MYGQDARDLLEPGDVCGGWYARTGAACEASRSLRWYDTGQLQLLYPDGVPLIVAEAVDVAAATKAAWTSEGMRRQRESAQRDTRRTRRG